MKRIFYIARNELYSLFYSPIAWILMTLFVVVISADFMGIMAYQVGSFERGGPDLMAVTNLTDKFSSFPGSAFFWGVIGNLYMIFPLITMGLISRELSSGTIRLLYSSPIRITEMVLGKFLAMFIFSLALLLLAGLPVTAFVHNAARPDHAHLFASLGGVFLVLCTYAAIGLFISSLTSYQIVAALVTLAIFALLSQIGSMWQDVDMLRNITYYMNIGGKASQLIKGVLNVRDVLYFLLLISAFLAFTIIRIRSGAESVSKLKKASRYLAVISIIAVAGYITTRPHLNLYMDATRDQVHTITPPTQAMLAKLDDGPLEITLFANLLFNFGPVRATEQNHILHNIWEKYIRFKPDIQVKFHYYYDQDTGSYYFKNNPGKTIGEIAEMMANTYGMRFSAFTDPETINKVVDVRKENYRHFFQLKYKGRTSILRVFDDPDFWPDENNIAASLNRLIDTPPKLCFLSDELERSPFNYRMASYAPMTAEQGNRMSLINQGYDFDTVSLRGQDIPKDIDGLVIADPRKPFSADALDKICRYIDAGGNLFLTIEPERKSIVKTLLDTLGISMRDGVLLQDNAMFAANQISAAYLTDSAKLLSPQLNDYLKTELKYYGDPLTRVSVYTGAPLEYTEKKGFRVIPLVTTDKAVTWNRIAPVDPDSFKVRIPRMASDEQGSFVTHLMLKRSMPQKEQRIFVSGDADYVMGDAWEPKTYNYRFSFWCFSTFGYGKFPANTLRPVTDDAFVIKVADLSLQKTVLLYIIPAMIGLVGFIILMRRKRK